MFYISQMQNAYYRNVQPADVFSLLLDNGGIKEVGFYYHNIIPECIRQNGVVIRDYSDTRKVFGIIEKTYTPIELWKIYTAWCRGEIGFICDEKYIKNLIEAARINGVYLQGTDKPYYKGGL